MDQQTFDQEVKKQWMRCERVLVKKADHYALDEDRLDQFKKIAVLNNTMPVNACISLMSKHVTKIYDMAEWPDRFKIKDWDESITDCINYLMLLRAIIEEDVIST